MVWLCSDIVHYCINSINSDGSGVSSCSNNNITVLICWGCAWYFMTYKKSLNRGLPMPFSRMNTEV